MLVIITLTQGGLTIANKISDSMKAKVVYKPKPFKETVHRLYKDYDQLVFVMATGIVVRTLGPLLQHKSKDPAVVVMDEKGTHVISFLSGHLGGANALSKKLAKVTGGTAVITTASDVNGLLAIDMLAEKYNLVLEDFDGGRDVTAVLVDGGKVQTLGLEIKERGYTPEKGDAVLYIGHDSKSFDQVSVCLKPKNLILSMGCRRDTAFEALLAFVESTLNSEGYSVKCINKLVSAWVKSDEKGFITLSNHLDIPFVTFDKAEILKVSNQFDQSDFVSKTIGVPCVSEPCGYLASHRGRCLINKRKHNGMTLSLWCRG